MTVAKESIVKVKRAMVRVDLQRKLQILRNVLIVLQVGRHLKAVQNVNLVRLENTAMLWVRTARIVMLVATERLPPMRRRVQHVHRGTYKMKKVKHHGACLFVSPFYCSLKQSADIIFLLLLQCSLPCIPGSYSDTRESTQCKDCAENTFSADKNRSSSCQKCPQGRTATVGSTKCSLCAAGKATVVQTPPAEYECHTCKSVLFIVLFACMHSRFPFFNSVFLIYIWRLTYKTYLKSYLFFLYQIVYYCLMATSRLIFLSLDI